MARPENPVDFGAKDGPADLVFFIAGSAGLTPVDPAVIAPAGAVDVDVDGRLRFIGTDDGLRPGRTRQKGAYSFAVAGLGAATVANQAPWQIIVTVMAAGMVPPLTMALAAALDKKLFSLAERENGKAAWLLGVSFF